MSDILLTTKLRMPQLRTPRVIRQDLMARLQKDLDKKLILISTPAGYGKTTLVLDWLSTYENTAAWVLLDKGDNNPVRFWSYIQQALKSSFPSIEKWMAENLSKPVLLTQESQLIGYLNAIDKLDPHVILVLDDYHVIHSQTVHDGVLFLINNAPQNFHLVILTRADPPLPLARYRGSSQMDELRIADLRFSKEEIAEFMRKVMKLNLSDEDLSLLEKGTEGWIAGLQMAGISMRGKENTSEFIKSFSGEDRYIMDFLFEEVFNLQSGRIQEFLLQTSILDRLCPSLCNAITKRDDGEANLNLLERNNLFLIPVDEKRQWYRYHVLFKDLLRNHQKLLLSESMAELYMRASSWYEAEGSLEIAISHALKAHDYEHAASLLEKISRSLDFQNQQILLTSWLERLPIDVIRDHPWLCIYKAWGDYWIGKREGDYEEWLQAAEKNIEGLKDDKENFLGHITTIRAHKELVINRDPVNSLQLAQKALDLLPKNNRMQCEAAIALAGSYWALGDVELTKKAFGLARDTALKINYPSMAAGANTYVGVQQIKQGLLNEAISTFQTSLKIATLPGGSEMPMAGFANCHLGDVWREKNKLSLASDYLLKGVPQCEVLGQPDILTDAYICLARYQLAEGEIEATHEILNKAVRVAQESKVDPWSLCWLDDCRIRVWQTVGDLESINLWEQSSGLSFSDPLDYQQDLHHQNLARVFVIRNGYINSPKDFMAAKILLDRLQFAAKLAGWVHEEIRILLLKAVNFTNRGFHDVARQNLVHAVLLAQPGEFIRVFLDEGEILYELFKSLGNLPQDTLNKIIEETNPDISEKQLIDYRKYQSKILSAYDQNPKDEIVQIKTLKGKFPYDDPLVEKLTIREIDVVNLLAEGLSDKRIAERLVISHETVHKHLKNIYSKLGVHNRTEAVMRAQALGLI
jgi:LuxR family maltose regulon positive regulatory protein